MASSSWYKTWLKALVGKNLLFHFSLGQDAIVLGPRKSRYPGHLIKIYNQIPCFRIQTSSQWINVNVNVRDIPERRAWLVNFWATTLFCENVVIWDTHKQSQIEGGFRGMHIYPGYLAHHDSARHVDMLMIDVTECANLHSPSLPLTRTEAALAATQFNGQISQIFLPRTPCSLLLL